jgi:hypothetical protein
MKKGLVLVMTLAAIVVLMTAGGSAQAAERATVVAETPDYDKWHFSMPIGMYYFGIEGPVAIGNVERRLELSGGDTNDKIDTAAGLSVEFGKRAWTGLASVSYLKFGGDRRIPPTAVLDLLELPAGTEFEPSLKVSTAEGGVAYRAIMKNPGPKAFVLEPFASIRYTKLEAGLIVDTPTAPEVNYDRNVSWEDLLVGVRLRKSFTKHFGMNFGGDYGVGISGNSKPLWDAEFGLGWRFPFDGWAMTLAAGYKAAGVQYEDSTESLYTQDLNFQGPVLGLGFSW